MIAIIGRADSRGHKVHQFQFSYSFIYLAYGGNIQDKLEYGHLYMPCHSWLLFHLNAISLYDIIPCLQIHASQFGMKTMLMLHMVLSRQEITKSSVGRELILKAQPSESTSHGFRILSRGNILWASTTPVYSIPL